jgi:putative endonuclease
MIQKQAFVYILANKRNGTIYTGVTSDLSRRIYEHKAKEHAKSFTAKYSLDKLVWYLAGDDIMAAIELEKKIKNRNRAWKVKLIEKNNPEWRDLSLEFLDPATYAQDDEVRIQAVIPSDNLVIPHEVAESIINNKKRKNTQKNATLNASINAPINSAKPKTPDAILMLIKDNPKITREQIAETL